MDTKKHLPAPHNGGIRDDADAGVARGALGDTGDDRAHAERSVQAHADREITALIKAALSALPDLVALRVGVDTRDGIVTLTRSVESRTQTEMAIAIAARTPGVKYVNDHLIAVPKRRKVGIRMPGSAAFLGSDGASDV